MPVDLLHRILRQRVIHFFDQGYGYVNSQYLHLKILDQMYDPCLFPPGEELSSAIDGFLTNVQAELERQLIY